MHVNYLYQKVRPSYISKNPNVDINDYGLICTLKRHNVYPFKSRANVLMNDPLVWSLFEKGTTDTGRYEADFLCARFVLNKSNRGSFLGFENISSFIHYVTILYVACKVVDIPELHNELRDISNIVCITDGVRVYKLSDFYDKLQEDYPPVAREFGVLHRIVEQMHIETCASQVYEHFRESLKEIQGDHIYLEYLDLSVTAIVNNETVQSFSPARSVFSNYANGFLQPCSYNTKKCQILQKNSRSGNYIRDDKYCLPSFSFLSYAVKKPTRLTHSLDDTLDDIKEIYGKKLGRVFETTQFNANFNADIDEYVDYRKQIKCASKMLGIKTTFEKTIKCHNDDLLKVKLVVSNKSTDALYKILSTIAAIDSNAQLSINGFYRDSTISSQDIYNHYVNSIKNLDKECGLENKYNNVRKYFHKGRPYGSGFVFSSIIKAIATGDFNHDVDLLKKLIGFRLSGSALSITLTCNDLKDMRKLKLFGVGIEEVRFHITDRKDVLEYFNNY